MVSRSICAAAFIFLILSGTVFSQEKQIIVIMDLDPMGGMLTQDALKAQSEAISGLLEASILKLQQETYGKDGAIKGNAEITLSKGAKMIIPGNGLSVETVKGSDGSATGGGEAGLEGKGSLDGPITLEGEAEVNIDGPVKLNLDNNLKKDILKLITTAGETVNLQEAQQVSNYLRAKIIDTNVFNVVEREKVNSITEEQKLKLADVSEGNETVELGKLFAAQSILMGTIGKLYGKIIVTVRFVDAEKASIIFADTIYTDESSLWTDMEILAGKIADKGIAMTTITTLDDVKRWIKARDFRKAKQYLDAYIQNKLATKESNELMSVINGNLAEQNYREAVTALNKRQYFLAKERINEALAVRHEEKYLNLKEKIILQEEQYKQKQQEKAQREKELADERKRRMSELSALSFAERAGAYYKDITVNGFHMGGSVEVPFSKDFQVDFGSRFWGGEITGLGELSSTKTGSDTFNWIAYIGLSVTWFPYNGANTVLLRPYLSPLLAWGVKLGNLIINIGLDGGGVFWITNHIPAGYLIGVSAGGLGLVEIKVYRRVGIYAGVKADYVFYPTAMEYSAPALRFMAGLTF